MTSKMIMTLLPWSTAVRLQQRTSSRRAMYVTLVQIFAISSMVCVHGRTYGLRIMHGDIEGINRTFHEYAPGLPRGHTHLFDECNNAAVAMKHSDAEPEVKGRTSANNVRLF